MSSSLRKSNIPERNVVKHLFKASIYGKPNKPTPVTQDLQFVLDKLSSCKDTEIRSLYITVKKLDEVLKPSRPVRSEAFKAFWNVKQHIHEIGKREENERFGKTIESVKWLKHQILLDLTKILHKFVMSYTVFPFKFSHMHERGEILQLRGIAFEIFHDIFVYFENLTHYFSDDHSFLVCLFTHLQYYETCFPACRVLECLLLAKKKILDLSTIDYLKEMVFNFHDVALGNFCKILAVTLSELDMYEHKTSLYAQTKQKKSQNFYIRDINQDLVLKIPKILPRLVNIACAKPYVPWFPSISMESEQWLQWIDSQCVEERNSGGVKQFMGGITEWNKYGVCGPNMPAIKIASELTFRADAVCVLGLLLVGRHRKEVQKELADLQLIPKLSDLFDHFIWRSNTRRDHTRLPGHNSSCECSPEVALKIQVLRLIHSFCDHSDYKHVMLSWNEYSELQTLEEASGSSTQPPWIKKGNCELGTTANMVTGKKSTRKKSTGNKSTEKKLTEKKAPKIKVKEKKCRGKKHRGKKAHGRKCTRLSRESMCVGVRGFLSKIVEVMKKESGASTFRFWLSRAIESYLRGSYSGADQDFLLRRNLLQHVIGNLITSNIRHKEVLQSSFDLLGELIRFNTNAFKELNVHLFNVARQRKLLSFMNGSLVDSNMFIRSLILSYESFMSSTDPDLKAFAETQCFLLSHVSTLNVRVHYLQKLLSLINIHNLTQVKRENVSCLNTALVILMFALRKAELPQYLQILASNQEGCSVATDQSSLMVNLRDLLIFWQDHYLQKDKDCTILERSSRIPFQEWKDTVTLLTSEDCQNPNSIAFFTMPPVSSRSS